MIVKITANVSSSIVKLALNPRVDILQGRPIALGNATLVRNSANLLRQFIAKAQSKCLSQARGNHANIAEIRRRAGGLKMTQIF